MDLLSIDITKVKRLSLRGVVLSDPERRIETDSPIHPIKGSSILFDNIRKTPTEEEIIYSKLVAINPLIEELVECLDLVSINTGERIKKIDLLEYKQPHQNIK